MHKSIRQVFILLFFLVSACAPSVTNIPIATTQIATETPSPIPTSTPTALPSATLTASITPLPTISTITPTLDTQTIVTITPAPKAECPKEDDNLSLSVHIPRDLGGYVALHHEDTINSFKDFLNAGGVISSIINEVKEAKWIYEFKDFTGDLVPELLFIDHETVPILRVFYCRNKFYELFTLIPTHEVEMDANFTRFWSISDLNLDGLPEVIWVVGGCSNSGCFKLFTLEWNGNSFADLSPDAETFGLESIEIQDVDKNKTKEIILKSEQPGTGTFMFWVPWRFKKSVYMWNGHKYALAKENFDPPQFRFQALQDADQDVLNKNYAEALSLYQHVIFDEQLDWWSPDKQIYYITHYFDLQTTQTPGPTLNPDLTEYPRLAAYAYYRIVLLHLAQGYGSDASTVYNALQQKFSTDQYARPYLEMATAFWEAYQSTNNMYNGCAAAIQYAVEHPEILIPLGSDYHGNQSHTYVPADVCPFR